MKVKNIISLILGLVFLGLIGIGIWVFFKGYVGGNRQAGFVEASGRIEGQEYHAAPKIGGRVDEIYVEEGQDVKLGGKIALIRSPQLEATIGQAEAYLRKAEANFKLAEAEYARYSRLMKEDAVARAEYDQVENRYTLAKEELDAAKKELVKLNADLEDTKILAPTGGRIITKIVQPGEVIAAGAPIVSIVNMDDLYLKVFLPTENAGKINIGDEARIYLDALPGEFFAAGVSKISEKAEFTPKNVETKSQRAKLVFEIRLEVKENKGYRLKPGMPAEAFIQIDKSASWDSLKIKPR